MHEGAELELGNWELLVEALLDEATFRCRGLLPRSTYRMFCGTNILNFLLNLLRYSRAGRCFADMTRLVVNNPPQQGLQQVQRQGLSKRPRFASCQADRIVKDHSRGPVHDPHGIDAVVLNRCAAFLADQSLLL